MLALQQESMQKDLNQNEGSEAYLIRRAVPHNNRVTRIDQIFHHSRSHDAQTKEAKLQLGWVDILLLENFGDIRQV